MRPRTWSSVISVILIPRPPGNVPASRSALSSGVMFGFVGATARAVCQRSSRALGDGASAGPAVEVAAQAAEALSGRHRLLVGGRCVGGAGGGDGGADGRAEALLGAAERELALV